MTGQLRRLLAPVLLVSAASSASLAVLSLFARDELGASAVLVTGYFVAVATGGAVATFALGRISDRGRNRGLLIRTSLAWLAVGSFLLARVHTLLSMLAIGVIFFSALNVANSQLLAHARDVLRSRPDALHGSLSMVTLIRVVFSLGSLLGFACGGAVLGFAGARPVFWASGVAYSLCLSLAWSSLRAPVISSHDEQPTPDRSRLRLVFALAAVMVLFSSGRVMQVSQLPIVVHESLREPASRVGLYLAIPPVAELALMPLAAVAARRWGRARAFLAGGVAIVVYYCGLAVVRQPWQLLLLQLCYAVFGAATVMVGIDVAQRLVPGRPGAATSAYLSHENVAVVTGSVVALASVAALGSQMGFLGPAGLCAVALGVAAWLLTCYPDRFDLRGGRTAWDRAGSTSTR